MKDVHFSNAISGNCDYYPFCGGSKSHGCKYDHSANGICPNANEAGLGTGKNDDKACVTRIPQCLCVSQIYFGKCFCLVYYVVLESRQVSVTVLQDVNTLMDNVVCFC